MVQSTIYNFVLTPLIIKVFRTFDEMFITTFAAKCRNFSSFAIYIHENPFGVCIIYQKALNSNVRALKVPNVEAPRYPLQSMPSPPTSFKARGCDGHKLYHHDYHGSHATMPLLLYCDSHKHHGSHGSYGSRIQKSPWHCCQGLGLKAA